MASVLFFMSSSDVAQPETLIRMAGRPSHTVGPHQHLVEHHVVQHLQARLSQAGGHDLSMVAGPHDEIGHSLPAQRAKDRPHLDLPGAL